MSELGVFKNTIYDKKFFLDFISMRYEKIATNRINEITKKYQKNWKVTVPLNSFTEPNIFQAISLMKTKDLIRLGIFPNILLNDLNHKMQYGKSKFIIDNFLKDYVNKYNVYSMDDFQKTQSKQVNKFIGKKLFQNIDYKKLKDYYKLLFIKLLFAKDTKSNLFLIGQNEAFAVEELINNNPLNAEGKVMMYPIYMPELWLFRKNNIFPHQSKEEIKKILLEASKDIFYRSIRHYLSHLAVIFSYFSTESLFKHFFSLTHGFKNDKLYELDTLIESLAKEIKIVLNKLMGNKNE